ncbi:hypothetical protein BC332_13537 [Capsicum chinense]|nr:hypothetical protein BC332_13537 [Capsicum chinense]
MPNHGNQKDNMITLEDEYDFEETIVPTWSVEKIATVSPTQPFITVQLRKPITFQTYLPRVVVTKSSTGRTDYNTKAVPWDYRAEAKGKIINAIMTRGMTRLGRISIPKEKTSETLTAAIRRVVEENKVSFNGDKLPSERVIHNKEFHIMVRYHDKVVNRVFFDGGSGCNIYPFSTLRDLGMNNEDIRKSRVKPKTGLGPKADGIVEPIQLKQHKGTTGLGYEPISRAAYKELEIAFQKLTIRDAKPGEAL